MKYSTLCALFSLSSDDEMHAKRIDFWDDVSGLKMPSMKSVVAAEPDICVVKKETIITEPFELKVRDHHVLDLCINIQLIYLNKTMVFCIDCLYWLFVLIICIDYLSKRFFVLIFLCMLSNAR